MATISGFDDDDFLAGLEKARRRRQPVAAAMDPRQMVRRATHKARSGGGVDLAMFERMIGTNDLVPINYLERGLMAARTVCLLAVPAAVGGDVQHGTGFMISPRLLLTNNHVIPSADAAARATATFGYEVDAAGQLRSTTLFRLSPREGFVTSDENELDFTVVAVREVADDGDTRLDEFGFLRLDAQTGKIGEGEFVTIIQHPGRETKRIALRENKLVKYGDAGNPQRDNFLWYSSDTAPGSSGAPVCNDDWQVVCVHHAGVPRRRGRGSKLEYRLVSGEWIGAAEARDRRDDEIEWIANEGVRISRIIGCCDGLQGRDGAARSPLVRALLDDASGQRPFAGTRPGFSVVGPPLAGEGGPAADEALPEPARPARPSRPPRKRVRPLSYFDGREGFDPDFLDEPVPLPTLTEAGRAKGEIAEVRGARDGVLRYQHFSVVMNATRRLAFICAVNIDGQRWVGLERGSDAWFVDPRIDEALQVGDELYGSEPDVPGSNQGWFDRGHLVRRQDPLWGDLDTVERANEDTFHWTNCAPQYWGFNRGFGRDDRPGGQRLWNGLEEFVLQNTKEERVRACVFNGPVFFDDDEEHRGIQVPRLYWKLVVVRDAGRELLSSGYVVSQERYATNIPFERLPVGPNDDEENFQVSVARIEELTGLAFSENVRDADVFEGQPDRLLRSFADIRLQRAGAVRRQARAGRRSGAQG